MITQALLHTPVTLPEMVEYGFALHPGTEAFLSVSPTAIVADRAIHGMPREKRQCYLSKEKELAFFRHYTFLNCFMECAANFTFKVGELQNIVIVFFLLFVRGNNIFWEKKNFSTFSWKLQE